MVLGILSGCGAEDGRGVPSATGLVTWVTPEGARYGGELPSDEETLLSFKGIGQYTAGAIRSFAFGQRAAILDTNVARILFRIFIGTGDIKAHAMRKHLWRVSEVLVPRKQVFDFNQALMDFGATVCVARKPKCERCPLTNLCTSYPLLSRPDTK